MRTKDAAIVRKKVDEFDRLSDDANISLPVAAALWGTSAETFKRNPPVALRQLSKRLVGVRVGDLRKRSRGSE
jgi:hypothetical protein